MKKCQLRIIDEVNCKFVGVSADLRRKCANEFKVFVPSAIYSPSYKLGHWNGFVNYFYLNGSTYIGLLDEVLPFIIDDGYDIEIVDERKKWNFELIDCVDENYVVDNLPNPYWPKKHRLEGQPIILEDHQVDLINAFLSNTTAIYEACTGAGKTITCAALSHIVEDYGRSIVIVPSKSLVRQTHADYANVGLDVGMYYGEKKDFGNQHIITTWQSVHAYIKKHSKNQAELNKFFKDVVCVIVDEGHTIKGKELLESLCGELANIPIRWSLTGTVPKPKHEYYPLLISVGPVVGEITAKELQAKGFLADCSINVIKLFDRGEFRDYHQEKDFLNKDKPRLRWMAEKISDISKSGNTLVLINTIDTGRTLQSLITDAKFIYGGTKLNDRQKLFDEIQTLDNRVLIGTYGLVSVGINLPRLFNIVMLEPGKSFVRVIQTIGRGLRKTNDKASVVVWDMCSSLKYSSAHLDKRLVFYRDAEYPYVIKETQW